MPHAALCVLGPLHDFCLCFDLSVSMPHAALCVLGQRNRVHVEVFFEFQCRTQHCVCWDKENVRCEIALLQSFNAARSIVCVGTVLRAARQAAQFVSMPHAALCVLGHQMYHLYLFVRIRFNAARSIVCVGTLCPAALVPRGLGRCFGKTRIFCAVFGVCG